MSLPVVDSIAELQQIARRIRIEIVKMIAAAGSGRAATTTAATIASKSADHDNVLDLGKYAKGAMLKRALPAIGVALLLLMFLGRRRRR